MVMSFGCVILKPAVAYGLGLVLGVKSAVPDTSLWCRIRLLSPSLQITGRTVEYFLKILQCWGNLILLKLSFFFIYVTECMKHINKFSIWNQLVILEVTSQGIFLLYSVIIPTLMENLIAWYLIPFAYIWIGCLESHRTPDNLNEITAHWNQLRYCLCAEGRKCVGCGII